MMASGSVLKQLDVLYDHGAQGKACFAVTHPILLPSALRRLDEDDRIDRLVVTNTIPVPTEKRHPKIEVLSIASLLSGIIDDIHEGRSILQNWFKTEQHIIAFSPTDKIGNSGLHVTQPTGPVGNI
jgi:ribose-phosphate pyrophosphokinase